MTENNGSGKTDSLLASLGTAQAQARISLDFANAVTVQAHQQAFAAQMGSHTRQPNTAHLAFTAAPPLTLLQGAFKLQTVIDRIQRVPEGHLIEVVMIPWFAIYREMRRDPGVMHQLTPLHLEELIAGAYKLAGFSSVIVTPRSGDHGRDVIATSPDGYTVRILDQAKKYGPDKVVGYDAIRAFIMVLDADRATRGFLTTTGIFPPDILEDPFIAPRLGSTLELVEGSNLVKRLGELANGAGP
jgi:restriction system protein